VSKFGKIVFLVVLTLLFVGGDAWATQTRPPPESSAPCDEQIVSSDPIMITVGEISRNRIKHLGQGFINPFEELWSIRLSPVDGGQGFQVTWITSSSTFAELGVQRYDIIRSLNGISLRNMSIGNILDTIDSLRFKLPGDQIITEVIRDGAIVLLRVDVKDDVKVPEEIPLISMCRATALL